MKTGMKTAMNKLSKAIVTGLGTGYLPIAPGTWGSAAACAVFLAVAALAGGGIALNAAMLALAAVASTVCVVLGRQAEEAFGRKDPSRCTIDEWAGQAVALLFLPLPAITTMPAWQGVAIAAAAAFVAFRVFDIFKPPPARAMEKLPLGWGVLADDLVAGLYANVVAQIFLRVLLGW